MKNSRTILQEASLWLLSQFSGLGMEQSLSLGGWMYRLDQRCYSGKDSTVDISVERITVPHHACLILGALHTKRHVERDSRFSYIFSYVWINPSTRGWHQCANYNIITGLIYCVDKVHCQWFPNLWDQIGLPTIKLLGSKVGKKLSQNSGDYVLLLHNDFWSALQRMFLCIHRNYILQLQVFLIPHTFFYIIFSLIVETFSV